MPSAAMAEWQRSEGGWLEEVIEARHYARAKWANDADPRGATSSELRALALTIELELAQEEIDGE